MKAKSLFIRSHLNESLICNLRNGGCLIFKNAQVFLDAITESEGVEDVVEAKVAKAYGCSPDEVRGDVHGFITMLKREGILSSSNVSAGKNPAFSPSVAFDANGNIRNDSWTPLGDFYQRHHLPGELHVDLTDRCNERCIHCYIPKGGGRLIDEDVFYKAVKEFREAQGLTLFVSGGECMLHPQFAPFLRFAKDLNLNIVVMSNLTLCDVRMVSVLQEIDPQFVNVSLYSMDAAIHDSITCVPGSWQKTMNAILALCEAGVPARLATPVMRANKDSLPALHQFATEHHLHLIPDCDIFGRIDHDCSNQQNGLSSEEMECVLKTNPRLFYKMPADAGRCACDAKVCDIGDARLNLNAAGDYYPCDGFHGMALGNAVTDALMDVWNGEKLNKLRALKNKDFGACATCANRAWCKVCPMRNFNETGDIFTHTPARCAATAIYRKVFKEN